MIGMRREFRHASTLVAWQLAGSRLESPPRKFPAKNCQVHLANEHKRIQTNCSAMPTFFRNS